jgi:gas vesicle protein
MPAAA